VSQAHNERRARYEENFARLPLERQEECLAILFRALVNLSLRQEGSDGAATASAVACLAEPGAETGSPSPAADKGSL
jgi:hypothetical protein